MLTAEVVTDPERARELAGPWDELAVAAGRPFCAPAWMLAWWRHLAPAEGELRVVVVSDGAQTLGVLPAFVQSTAARIPVLRLLCAGFTARTEPLARPGRAPEVARAGLAALAERPDAPGMLALEGLPGGSGWPAAFAGAWPGRGAWRHSDVTMPGPVVELGEDGYDQWLQRRRPSFRKEARRRGRRIADAGASIRCAGRDELEPAVAALLALYRARWDPRGGSGRTTTAVERMVLEAGEALAGDGRLEVWLLDAGGEPAAAQLFVRAGEESGSWGGGFDDRVARLAPTIMLLLAAIEHGAARGVRRVDLGEGDQPYKLGFADRDAGMEWATVFPRGRHYPLARAQVAPKHLRWWARRQVRRLPPDAQRRLKRILRRTGAS